MVPKYIILKVKPKKISKEIREERKLKAADKIDKKRFVYGAGEFQDLATDEPNGWTNTGQQLRWDKKILSQYKDRPVIKKDIVEIIGINNSNLFVEKVFDFF